MVNYKCSCGEILSQKSHLKDHLKRKKILYKSIKIITKLIKKVKCNR